MKSTLTTLVPALLLGAAALLSAPVQAQAFPSKPVRLIVPNTAGGPIDAVARGLADQLTKIWNQPVLVENRPGANEIVAAEYVSKTPPDGYTILLGSDGTFSNNQFLYSKLPYNTATDLVPVTRVTFNNMAFIVDGSFPANTLKEFVALVKANPGKYNYASGGSGSATHIYYHAFLQQNGLQMPHIPYLGIAPAIQGMLTGQVQSFMAGASAATPYLASGKMKILAINGDKRAKSIPSVPTLAEAGFPSSETYFFLGLAVSKGTPKAVLDEIARANRRALSDPAFVEKTLDVFAFEPRAETPEQFAEFLVKERAKKERDIRDANVKLD